MGNPFKFFLTRENTTHRLTDIETEEVSLVDKGANKRKFAVIKRDLETKEMSKGPEMFEDINKTESVATTPDANVVKETPVVDEKASAILQSMTTGLEKLASLTELVKSAVEKSEVTTDDAIVQWQTAMADVTAWADSTMKSHFIKAEVVAAPPETVVTEEKKTEETVTDAAVTTNETVVETAKEEVVAKSATEILLDVQATILDLASTVPSLDAIKAAIAKMDGLYVSGGLYIDAYDVKALAAVCNAVCEAMCDPNAENDSTAMKKSADKILGEISKRTVAVTKRVAKANATTSADGKELKIAALMLKALENGLTATPEVITTEVKEQMDETAIKTLVDAAVTKAVGDAVTKAVTELNKQNSVLTTQVETLKADKVELNKKLTASMSETQTRGSSVETVTLAKNNETVQLFPMDYNAPSFAELNK